MLETFLMEDEVDEVVSENELPKVGPFRTNPLC